MLNSPLIEKSTEILSPIVCVMDSLTPAQKTRTCILMDLVKTTRLEIKEFPDGYAFRYTMDTETLNNTMEFIGYERLCCPFFYFGLSLESEGGPLWLRLGGRDGVKEFIKTEYAVPN
jgi:hypothetical protein